ncbi:DNA (cytosine-5-)-methyltransferase [Brevibacillus brevis]|uniref:DNA (cytosine-5-)-methyltransferase n=1 Tax=Brevibacillus brevis TaxID=1393 RepID=UPI0031B80E85
MLSLFAGIGGIDLAAHWAGIETVAFCEIEPFCQNVLQKHWPSVPIFDDVRSINKQQLIEKGVIGDERSIDIICGGYPCQPFSTAGERLGEKDDRHLWPEMFRLIKELRPTWILGENVDGHVTLGLDTVLADLEREGYSTRAFIIPACGVNAPHRRYRIFVVAYSGYKQPSRRDEAQKGYEHTSGRKAWSELTPRCNVADPESERCGETREYWRRSEKRTAGSSTLGNTNSLQLQRKLTLRIKTLGRGSQTGEHKGASDGAKQQGAAQSRLGGALDGLSEWLDGIRWPAAMGLEQYEWEPPRVITGMNGKVREARLKALGNAVNPVQVLPILWGIKQIHDNNTKFTVNYLL